MQAPVSAGELLKRAVHIETMHHPVVPVLERPWITQVGEAKHVVVFTGAGISTSVGIPDFRCSLTSQLPAYSGRAARAQPALPMFAGVPQESGPSREPANLSPRSRQNSLQLSRASPTRQAWWPLHMQSQIPTPRLATAQPLQLQVIQALLRQGTVKYVVSQNVDGLHLRSGTADFQLAELHGSCFKETCPRCHHTFTRDFEVETVLPTLSHSSWQPMSASTYLQPIRAPAVTNWQSETGQIVLEAWLACSKDHTIFDCLSPGPCLALSTAPAAGHACTVRSSCHGPCRWGSGPQGAHAASRAAAASCATSCWTGRARCPRSSCRRRSARWQRLTWSCAWAPPCRSCLSATCPSGRPRQASCPVAGCC